MNDKLRFVARVARSPLTWLILATVFLYQLSLVPYWKPTWDSATYISLAHAMAHGDGYTYMGYPHIKYPPGFPLLLTPIEFLFGHHYWLMRLMVVCCAIGSVGLSFLLLRSRSGTLIAVGIAAMTAGSYALLFESTRILSDVPYMLGSLGALVAADHYLRQFSRRNLILLMALVVVSYSIRLIGFVLAPAVAVALLSHPRICPRRTRIKHALLIMGVMVVVVSGWMGRNAVVQKHLPSELREALSYERELIVINPSDPHSTTVGWTALVGRVRQNIPYYEQLLANLLTSQHTQRRGLMHLFSLLLVVGWALTWYRKRGVLEYYVFFYLWVYLLWPSPQGERFLVPVLPMLFYYVLQPLLLLFAWLKRVEQGRTLGSPDETPVREDPLPVRHIVPVIQWSVLGVLAAIYVILSAPGIRSFIHEERLKPYYRGEVAQYIEAIHWVRDNSTADSVIITDRAPWAYLLSGRPSFTSPWVDNPSEVLISIERNGGTHVIANDWGYSGLYLKPVIASHPERFIEVHRIGGQAIYLFQRPEHSP